MSTAGAISRLCRLPDLRLFHDEAGSGSMVGALPGPSALPEPPEAAHSVEDDGIGGEASRGKVGRVQCLVLLLA